MAFSYSEATGDYSTTVFTFSFSGEGSGYIREEDILVFIKTDGEWQEYNNFTLSGVNQVQLAVAPPHPLDGLPNIRIRRVVPKETPYSIFGRGNNFGATNVNNNSLQQLYAVHELMDGFFPPGYFVKSDMNFKGSKITNLAPGISGTDAVNVDQLQVVNALATTTVDKVEAAAAGVVAASSEVDANLLVSTAALAETRELANVVSASASIVEGLAEEVLVTAAAQAISYTEAVQNVQLAGQAIKIDAVQLVQEEISLSEARATEASLVQAGANTAAIAECTAQRVMSESNSISAAASASIATTATGAFAAIHADAITQLEPMVAAAVSAVSLAQAGAVDSEQSRVASDVSAAAAQDSAVHAEEQVVLAGIESSRAAAYANATGNSLSITSSISDIVGDVIDLEYLVLQASAFTNENYPLLRMDLAAESDVLDLGGLT